MKFIVLLLVCGMACSGCMVMAVNDAAYSAYLDTMRKTNTQLEVAGLEPKPILTRSQWRKTLQ